MHYQPSEFEAAQAVAYYERNRYMLNQGRTSFEWWAMAAITVLFLAAAYDPLRYAFYSGSLPPFDFLAQLSGCLFAGGVISFWLRNKKLNEIRHQALRPEFLVALVRGLGADESVMQAARERAARGRIITFHEVHRFAIRSKAGTDKNIWA